MHFARIISSSPTCKHANKSGGPEASGYLLGEKVAFMLRKDSKARCVFNSVEVILLRFHFHGMRKKTILCSCAPRRKSSLKLEDQ